MLWILGENRWKETARKPGTSEARHSCLKCIKYVELDAIRWTTSTLSTFGFCPEHAAHGPESRGPRAVRSRALACGVSRYSHTHYVTNTMSDLRLYTYWIIYTTRISNTLITAVHTRRTVTV